MRRMLIALPLLLLAASCATGQHPYNPVDNVRYSAMGQNPFWLLTIGDDRIVLRMAEAESDVVWPRTLPRTQGDVTVWDSGEGTQVITIAARKGFCRDAGGRGYEDEVRIRLSGVELFGCGGRMLEQGAG